MPKSLLTQTNVTIIQTTKNLIFDEMIFIANIWFYSQYIEHNQ